jgi:hypothetical protein
MLDLRARSELTQPRAAGLRVGGTYTGHTASQFFVQIDGLQPDTFTWMKDGVTMAQRVPLPAAAAAAAVVPLTEGVTVEFLAVAAPYRRQLGDQWLVDARPINAIRATNDTTAHAGGTFVVAQDGLLTALGGLTIDMPRRAAALRLDSGALRLDSGGISIAAPAIQVRADVRAEGLLTVVNTSAFEALGGVSIRAGRLSVDGGATVHGGAAVSGGLSVLNGSLAVTNGSLGRPRSTAASLHTGSPWTAAAHAWTAAGCAWCATAPPSWTAASPLPRRA